MNNDVSRPRAAEDRSTAPRSRSSDGGADDASSSLFGSEAKRGDVSIRAMAAERPSFPAIYITLARALAARSTCGVDPVGAVITSVDFRKVLAIGYRGNASGLPNVCDHAGPDCGCLHAEENAVIHCDAPRTEPKIAFSTALPCRACAKRLINLGGRRVIAFDEKRDLVFNKRQKLPYHSNGMRFSAFDAAENTLFTRDYYSVGGGFVVNHDEAAADRIVPDATPLPHPFHSGDELLQICREQNLSIAQVIRLNERAWRDDSEIDAQLDTLWAAMQDCVARGMRSPGVLPGGLKVGRRAPQMPQNALARHVLRYR